ncbi:hypothetical protein B0813_000382 [Candidatus Fervidibacteria bacterium JGI MDM2 SSWTFF-3-K9]
MKSKGKVCWLFSLVWLTILGIGSFCSGQATSAYRELYGSVDEKRLREVVETLASFGSRVVGYPGERLAAEYVRQQFLALGLDTVREQVFYAVTPIEETPTYIEIPPTGQALSHLPPLAKPRPNKSNSSRRLERALDLRRHRAIGVFQRQKGHGLHRFNGVQLQHRLA